MAHIADTKELMEQKPIGSLFDIKVHCDKNVDQHWRFETIPISLSHPSLSADSWWMSSHLDLPKVTQFLGCQAFLGESENCVVCLSSLWERQCVLCYLDGSPWPAQRVYLKSPRGKVCRVRQCFSARPDIGVWWRKGRKGIWRGFGFGLLPPQVSLAT